MEILRWNRQLVQQTFIISFLWPLCGVLAVLFLSALFGELIWLLLSLYVFGFYSSSLSVSVSPVLQLTIHAHREGGTARGAPTISLCMYALLWAGRIMINRLLYLPKILWSVSLLSHPFHLHPPAPHPPNLSYVNNNSQRSFLSQCRSIL